jgi:hypothetical protein
VIVVITQEVDREDLIQAANHLYLEDLEAEELAEDRELLRELQA